MRLESILGRLHSLLRLEPDKTELVLDVVDHDLLTLFTTTTFFLGGGVSTLELDVDGTGLLQELAAVTFVENAVNLLDPEGIGEKFVSREKVLKKTGVSVHHRDKDYRANPRCR